MGNHDIDMTFTDNEKNMYNFIEKIYNVLYKNKNYALVHTDEDVYMQKIMEYYYDSIIPIDEIIDSESIITFDLSPVFTRGLSSDLCKIILEMVFIDKIFLNINNYTAEFVNTNSNELFEIDDIVLTLIDEGLVSGVDIGFFSDREKIKEMIKAVIADTLSIVRDTTESKELIFIGWLHPNRLALIKYTSKEAK